MRIEYLPQNPYYDENATVLEQVFKGTCEEMKIIGDYQDVLDKINKSYDEKLNDRLLKLQEKMDALNLWALESSAKTVLTKLGIKDFNQTVKELSGGQRKRVSLASALITPCELLILDEPTNHLDIDSKEVLEEALSSYTGTIFTISHDRYFLNTVVDKVLVLDENGITEYLGNYDYYIEKKKQVQEMNTVEVIEEKTKTQLKEEKRKEREQREAEKKNRVKRQNIEKEIEETEAKIEEMDVLLCQEEVYSNPEKSKDVSLQKASLEEKLSALYEEWESLM